MIHLVPTGAFPILLITDSINDAQSIQHMLENGLFPSVFIHQQYSLQGGAKAVSLLKIELIIMDLELPDSYGLKSFIEIHSLYPDIPIIVIVRPQDIEMGKAALVEGASTYLVRGTLSAGLLTNLVYVVHQQGLLLRFLNEAQSLVQIGHWKLDTSQNIFWCSTEAQEILGKNINSLEDYFFCVNPTDQRRVAMAFMKALQDGERFVLRHGIGDLQGWKEVVLHGEVSRDLNGRVNLVWGTLRAASGGEVEQVHNTVEIRIQPEIVSDTQSEPKYPQPVEPTNVVKEPEEIYFPPITEKLTNVNYLLEIAGGDRIIMQKAIRKFLENTPEIIQQMEDILAIADYGQLAKIAHKLKSSVSLMGMEEVLNVVKSIEAVCKNRDRLDVLPILVGRVSRMVQKSYQELKEELALT